MWRKQLYGTNILLQVNATYKQIKKHMIKTLLLYNKIQYDKYKTNIYFKSLKICKR